MNFLIQESTTDRKPNNKQRDCVVCRVRNEKKNFYSNLDSKFVTDNGIFWKTIKLFLSETVTKHSKINLFEGKRNGSRDDQIAKKLI